MISTRRTSVDNVQKQMFEYNKNGWCPIHEAAYKGYANAVKRFIENSPDKQAQLELVTKDEQAVTPLLMAALGSNLEIVQFLYESGASLTALDSHGHSIVEIAALRHDLKLFHFLNKLDTHNELNIWPKLIKLFTSSVEEFSATCARFIESLTDFNFLKNEEISSDTCIHFCDSLVKHGILNFISKIINQAQKDTVISCFVILLNLIDMESEEKNKVGADFLKYDGFFSLINLTAKLAESDPDKICLAGKLLNKLSETKEKCAACFSRESVENLQKIVHLIIKGLERLQEPSVVYSYLDFVSNILEFCDDEVQIDLTNRKLLASITIEFFKSFGTNEFLVNSLLRLTCLLASSDSEIQTQLIENRFSNILQQTLKYENETTRVLSIESVQHLCKNNVHVQSELFKDRIDDILLSLLAKYHTRFLKNVTIRALWSITGNDFYQQRTVVNKMSISLFNECISDKDDELYKIGCDGLAVLFEQPSSSAQSAHETYLKVGNVYKLVRILTNPDVTIVLSGLRCMKRLCCTCGENAHKNAQGELKKADALPYLVALVLHGKQDLIRAEAANVLAYMCLDNKENLKLLFEKYEFSYSDIFGLFTTATKPTKLLITKAIAIFIYNNIEQEAQIILMGSLFFNAFKSFYYSSDETERCEWAYQVIILSQLFGNQEHSKLIANGIQILVSKFEARNAKLSLRCFIAEKFVSLSRLKNGIVEAMIEINFLDIMIKNLNSKNEMLEGYLALILSNLTHNFKARRKLLNRCRHDPSIVKTLEFYNNYPGSNHKLSETFLTDWKHSNQYS